MAPNTRLKRAARARQKLTGERYTEALVRVKETLKMSAAQNYVEEYGGPAFAAAEAWLKDRGFRFIKQKNKLLFSHPEVNRGVVHELEIREAYEAEHGEEARLRGAEMSLYWSVNTADGTVLDGWEGEINLEDPSCVELVAFVLESKFPSIAQLSPKKEITSMIEARLVAAQNEAKYHETRARNAEARIADLTGEGLPDVLREVEKRGASSTFLPLWSTFKLAKGKPYSHTTNRMFYAPLGQEGQGFSPMTITETNMKEAGRIPGGFGCHVKYLMVEVFGEDDDVAKVRQGGILRFDFVQTVFDITPLSVVIKPGESLGVIKPLESVGEGLDLLDDLSPTFLPINTTFGVLLDFGSVEDVRSDVQVRVTLGLVPKMPSKAEIEKGEREHEELMRGIRSGAVPIPGPDGMVVMSDDGFIPAPARGMVGPPPVHGFTPTGVVPVLTEEQEAELQRLRDAYDGPEVEGIDPAQLQAVKEYAEREGLDKK